MVRLESPGAHAQTGGVKTCLDSAGTAKLADSRNVFRVSKSRERDRWKQGGSGVEGRKKLLKNARALGRPGRLGNPCKRTETSEPLVRGHPCPHWRISGVRPDLSAEPNGLEHANDDPSGSGSAEVTAVMRAGFHGSQPGSAGALAGPTRSIARTIRSRLSVEAQASEVSPA